MTTDIAMRTIEVYMTDGAVQRLTFPATWKITFGAVVPTAGASSGASGWGLRIYEAQDKQRAAITEVRAFIDISIDGQRRAIRRFGTADWYEDDGSWTGQRADLVEAQWVDWNEIKEGEPPYQDELKPEDHDESVKYPSFAAIRTRPKTSAARLR